MTALMASRPFMQSGLNVLGALELELRLTDRDILPLSWGVFSLKLGGVNNIQIFLYISDMYVYILFALKLSVNKKTIDPWESLVGTEPL